jgi:hypothetical protein
MVEKRVVRYCTRRHKSGEMDVTGYRTQVNGSELLVLDLAGRPVEQFGSDYYESWELEEEVSGRRVLLARAGS